MTGWERHAKRERKNREDRPFNYLCGTARLNAIFGKREHACVQCGATKRLEVDHIKPKMKKGKHLRSNLQILCADCHRLKTFADLAETESQPVEIWIGPNRYRSLHEAERKTGFSRKTLRKHRDNGTLDTLVGKQPVSKSGMKIETYYKGVIYESRTAIIVTLGIGNSRLERDLYYGSSAWDFKTFRKSRRWISLERHMHDEGKRKCAGCPKPATCLIHAEKWDDLMIFPFDLPTIPVCRKCRREIEGD